LRFRGAPSLPLDRRPTLPPLGRLAGISWGIKWYDACQGFLLPATDVLLTGDGIRW
jgi:hypothetical protein